MAKTFRPSKAGYWSKCAAFQRFTSDLPKQESGDAAQEGTCAGWVADSALKSFQPTSDLIGESHSNGWLVTSEMAADMQLYVNLVQSFEGIGYSEEYVVANENPLIEGTLDASVIDYDKKILRIIDLKYGRKIVETTSAQLVCYGYGKLKKLPENSVNEIHLSIYQPRGFHKDGIHRTRVITPDQLKGEFFELWRMALEGEKPGSMATAGPHCSDCPASAGCLAHAQTTYNLVEFVKSRDHRKMSALELSRELDLIEECEKTIMARFKAVTAEAEARAEHESIPGWSLNTKKGNSVFSTSATNVQLLTGVDPWQKTICTPAELLRRGATDVQIKDITKRPETGRKLARFSEADVAKIFKD